MAINRVCSSCFDDKDLRSWVREANGRRGCDACGKFDSPTCKLSEICERIESCLKNYWGFAVEQLPYESAEGGYQGTTWNTGELLSDEVGLFLPRDNRNRLFYAIIGGLTDEAWCDYDWLTLDHDVALGASWESFCETVKHKRRFFFHSEGADDRDSYTALSLLAAIAITSERIGLIRDLSINTKLWRARPDLAKGKRVCAASFGPPPEEFALQSNRMNPPGIPMLYLASSAKTALKETRAREARVGQWVAARPLRVLDLRDLPDVPGIFSDTARNERLELIFLHRFARDVMTPVERDQRVHVDYLPSQVVTEFFRDFDFENGRLDGVAYGSTVHPTGWNVALFANLVDLGLEIRKWGARSAPWLHYMHSVRTRL
ncbi:HEPN-associated N-terminal domain-containing protein [Collimonas sp.]|uniref:HEPN-associated N-terminal domain-containing protein n=1 Tax=Collimonas sp. TaxID=1963772 RepID=UPI002C86C6E7|nr:HEPN-associated N-terminal domain-containing protein [Collimonas sp.]HWX01419.1 HEPN-associated N-terminal domain-containing protein [Collimonas sp.]